MIFKSLCRHAGIGANSYLIETRDARVVLDSGMHPKHEGMEATPHFEFLEDCSVDSIVITHSHLDHVGTLPVLMERQPHAKVFLTQETAALAEAMLHNSVNVMQSKRIEHGITEYPLFEHKQIDHATEVFELRGIERPFDLDFDGKLRGTFYDAGHILGSVGVVIEGGGKRVFYTGDVNFEPSTIQQGARFPDGPFDSIIVETTRGAQARAADYNRLDEENAFAECIERTLQRGGAVLVPVFAMGKTQEVLGMLHRFREQGRIPDGAPIHIGGLSTKMTHIYDRYSDVSRRKMGGFQFLKDMDLASGGNNRSRRRGPIPLNPGAIYALSSGMMSENTVSYIFAKQGFLENKKNGLFFVGYADPETPGGRIRAAKTGDKVLLDPTEKPIPMRCEMRAFDFSGHSTREAIAQYVIKTGAKKVFLVHGDDDAAEWFRQTLTAAMPDSQVIIPIPGQEHVL
jgi:Cft2 family RNA processing exonuclease